MWLSSSVQKNLITLSYENLLHRVEWAWHVTDFLAHGAMIEAKRSEQVPRILPRRESPCSWTACDGKKRKTVMVGPQRTTRLRGKDIGNKNRKKIFYHIVLWIIFKEVRQIRV